MNRLPNKSSRLSSRLAAASHVVAGATASSIGRRGSRRVAGRGRTPPNTETDGLDNPEPRPSSSAARPSFVIETDEELELNTPVPSLSRRYGDFWSNSSDEDTGDEYRPPRGYGTVSSDDSYSSPSDESEEEEVEPEETNVDPDSDVDVDYVSVHNSSMDSNEPLSTVREDIYRKNAPGTTNFSWRDADCIPRKNCFANDRVHGVKDPDLSRTSTPLECFRAFFTREIWSHVVTETNR